MIRAVAMDAALIGGPYQGMRCPRGTSPAPAAAPRVRHATAPAAPRAAARRRAPRPRRRRCPARRARPARRTNAASSVAASSDCSSVQARWAIWCATVQPGRAWAGPTPPLEPGHEPVHCLAFLAQIRENGSGHIAGIRHCPAPPVLAPALVSVTARAAKNKQACLQLAPVHRPTAVRSVRCQSVCRSICCPSLGLSPRQPVRQHLRQMRPPYPPPAAPAAYGRRSRPPGSRRPRPPPVRRAAAGPRRRPPTPRSGPSRSRSCPRGRSSRRSARPSRPAAFAQPAVGRVAEDRVLVAVGLAGDRAVDARRRPVGGVLLQGLREGPYGAARRPRARVVVQQFGQVGAEGGRAARFQDDDRGARRPGAAPSWSSVRRMTVRARSSWPVETYVSPQHDPVPSGGSASRRRPAVLQDPHGRPDPRVRARGGW